MESALTQWQFHMTVVRSGRVMSVCVWTLTVLRDGEFSLLIDLLLPLMTSLGSSRTLTDFGRCPLAGELARSSSGIFGGVMMSKLWSFVDARCIAFLLSLSSAFSASNISISEEVVVLADVVVLHVPIVSELNAVVDGDSDPDDFAGVDVGGVVLPIIEEFC